MNPLRLPVISSYYSSEMHFLIWITAKVDSLSSLLRRKNYLLQIVITLLADVADLAS